MRKFSTLVILLMLFGVYASAQSRVVNGTITDEKGAVVDGASVTIKGQKTGTYAGANGSFKISAHEGATLIISGVGITTQEFNIGNQTKLNLQVTRSSTQLTAVIVTAAGLKKSERSVGYAVSKVNPSSLLQQSEPDLLRNLQGKVAGVDIRSGLGTPGSATRIQIRGNSSFFGDAQPLIIVDGIPYSNDQVQTIGVLTGGGAYGNGLADIDPNDIASMNILKGSSASALYGSRASNGVIVITTKSGSAGRSKKGTEVVFRTSISFENIANLPDYQNLYGTGSQGNASGGSNGSWGKNFEPGDSVEAWADYLRAYPELFPNGMVSYQPYPNNVNDLFTTGILNENSIGINTGDEKTSFALTASELSQSGYVPNNDYNKINLSGGGSSRLDIGLNISANFSYSRTKQTGGLLGENQDVESPSSQFARTMFLGRSWPVNLPYEDQNGNNVSWVGTQADHPLWAEKYNKQTTYDERMVAGLRLDFNITKWARVDYNIGSNVFYLNRQQINEVSSRGGLGKLALDNYRAQELESTLLLTLTPNTGNNFSTKATFGIDYYQRTRTRELGKGGYREGGGGYIVRGVYTLQNFLPVDRDITDYYSRKRIQGIFGDISVGYKNFAFVTVTGRNDVSSTLPEDNRSYFYPSISGSFVFSDAFKISNTFLDFGKIRGGYAKVGRDAEPYNEFNVYNLSNTAFLNQAVGNVSPDAKGGNSLQPEFTKELELGAQVGFFKRFVELDFTWYNKNSSNLLAPVTTPSSTGYTSYYTNFGSINNKGVEIALTLRPVTKPDIAWEILGVFTKNKSVVTSLTDGVTYINLGGGYSNITTGLEVGKPYGFLYGTKVLRDSASGSLLIDPSTGTMILDPEQGEIGNPNPDYKLGVTNTVRYKAFFLSVLFDMTKGGDLYSTTILNELTRGVTMDTYDRLTGWVIPGVYGDAITGKAITDGGKTIPNQTRITTNDLYFSPNGGNTFAANTATEWNVYDATVYRIRELSIGYNVPTSFLKRSHISAVTITLTGRNLWYSAPGFPRYSNFDPETSSYGASSIQGLEFSATATARRIGLNLYVTF
jgi:TonB-linked SusC/RagA family outer membrane protein